MSEKTEAPTTRRLQKAREDGQFARSRILSGAAVSGAVLWAVVAGAESSFGVVRGFTIRMLSGSGVSPGAALQEALWALAVCAAPPLLAGVAAAWVVSTAFVGFNFTAAAVIPKLDRLNPAEGAKRILSKRQLGETLRAVAICSLVAWVAWRGVREAAPGVLRAISSHAPFAAAAFLEPLGGLVLQLLGVFAMLGIADYGFARRTHLLELRMSRQEVKQEHKESEGDPRHRAHRKAVHRQLAQRGPARGVQTATAVIVNPTHIAVAVRYSTDECEAPYLVAKGREGDALALRLQAKRFGIPIVRDIPLARSLIHFDVGEEIPEELYRAVAGVLHAAEALRAADARLTEETP